MIEKYFFLYKAFKRCIKFCFLCLKQGTPSGVRSRHARAIKTDPSMTRVAICHYESPSLREVQGVRVNVYFTTKGLKSTILDQNWPYMTHLNENIPPFMISSKKFRKLIFKEEIFDFLYIKGQFSTEHNCLLLSENDQKEMNGNFHFENVLSQ